MNTSEKFCLKWNDFKENVSNTFVTLRKENDFTDVTLACEEDKQVEAHKVVLAASSTFFQNVLKRNKHAHPLIYMKGMKYEDLLAIVDFMYHGETNIYQENLDSFLSIAEDLCLKGLVGETKEFQGENLPNTSPPLKPARMKYISKSKHPSPNEEFSDIDSQTQEVENYNKHQEPIAELDSQPQEPNVDRTFSISEDYNEVYKVEKIKQNEDLNETLNSMISRNGEAWTCNSCGKVSNDKRNLKKHVANMHTEGLEFSCPRCEKIFRSRKGVYNHTASNHK